MWWSDWWGGHGPVPWMFFGPLMMIFFLLACAAVMYLVMRGAPMGRHRDGRAVEILKERYARGEINQAEFEERRRLLEA
jgi:putative membrane protein